MNTRSTTLCFFVSSVIAASAQNAFDARILSYEGLDFACEGMIEPTLKIQNMGTNTMSTCVVETWKNGLPVSSFNWILAVPALTGDVRQPTLPPVGGVSLGDEVEFRIKTVNTVPDQDPVGNILNVAMDRIPEFAQGGNLSMDVTTGSVPGSVMWVIKNSGGQVVAEGGPYEDANTTLQVPVSLDDSECYKIEALDASRGSAPDIVLQLVDAQGVVLGIEGADLLTPFTDGLRTGTGLPCDQDVTIELSTDEHGEEVSWEIVDVGGQAVVCSGGGLASNSVITGSCCLQVGCYTLRVLDAGGDGMTTGGYILRTTGTNERIIDNRNNFSSGSVSAISAGQGFCLPLSNDKLLFTSCDKLDWISGQYVVAAPNTAVSSEWIANGANSAQDANSGYEFWIFDPNGSYSFRRFRSHHQSDGFGPASAARACHMKLNNWAAVSHVPANVLMNVRVRARINGVNGAYGPACRLEVNPVLAACPRTNLMDVPGSSQFSCGVARQFGPGNYLYARPVSGANRYQFRFRIAAEGFEVVRTSNTYLTQLNWSTLPLQNGKTYDVDVRVSKNGGATWCTNDNDAVWGPVCQVTIGTMNVNANSLMDDVHQDAQLTHELRLFPNLNRGDVLNCSISAIEEGVNTVSMDIYDLTGKRMSARTLAVADGNVNTVIDLAGELAAGMYLVNITAGERVYTERLVIQP
jgi:hypothetical protein